MQYAAILLAAGSGSRMRGAVDDKITVSLAGRPVFVHCAESFVKSGLFARLVVVCRDSSQCARLRDLYFAAGYNLPCSFVMGGAERQDSVRNGLRALAVTPVDFVFIHDCARPLVSPAQLRELATLVAAHGAAVLAHRVVDTIKRVAPAAREAAAAAQPVDLEDLERNLLWAMETPQAFRFDWISEAYERVAEHITDDVAALERLGHRVALLENPHPNPKVTRPQDLNWIEFLLQSRNLSDR